MPFRKIVILAKLLLCETSSSTVNKMRGDKALGNIDHFIGGHILFRTKRTYFLNKSEKTPLCKIGILAKLLLCETSSSTVNKMRGDQALGNIDHFIGGHILFWTKRAYLLNKGEKTPFRKIVIVAKLLLCEIGKNPSFSVNYYFQTHCHSVVLNCV